MNETAEPTPPAPGVLLIVSGPSGVGKSTLVNAVLDRLDADLSVSMTTRPQTAADVEAQSYFFVDVPAFEDAIAGGRLLEHAVYAGNFYGTPRGPVEEKLAAGRTVIVEIDVEGARQVKASRPDSFAIFIEPPHEDALLERLRSRQREDETTIQKRLSLAKKEIAFARSTDVYDAFVVNDDFDRALGEICTLIGQRLATGSTA